MLFFPFIQTQSPAASGASPSRGRALIPGKNLFVHESLESRLLLSVSLTADGYFAKVNFQPAGAAVPAGYVADVGLVYGDRGNGLSYGWDATNTAATRDRNAANSPDQRYDTLTHTQKD